MTVPTGSPSMWWALVRRAKSGWDRRSWLRYLRQRALRDAFEEWSEEDPRLAQRYEKQFGAALDAIGVPDDPDQTVVAKVRRWSQRNITRGVVMPHWTGRHSETFYRTLEDWVLAASDTPEGKRCLGQAFPEREDLHKKFAQHVVRCFMNRIAAPSDLPSHEYVQTKMRHDLGHGEMVVSTRQRARTKRGRGPALLAGAGAGVATWAATDNPVTGIGTAAALTAVVVVVERFASREEVDRSESALELEAIRVHALAWVLSLGCEVEPVTHSANVSELHGWRLHISSPPHDDDTATRLGERVESVDTRRTNVRIRRAYAEPDVIEDLVSLRQDARDLNDAELAAALTSLQTALLYAPSLLMPAVERLMVLAGVLAPEVTSTPSLARLDSSPTGLGPASLSTRQLRPGPTAQIS